MWTLLKALIVRFVAGRTIGGVFALLFTLFLPVAGILKFIGLPLLLVLGVIGAPVFLLLAVIGLPILLVVAMGGVLLFILGGLLSLGLLAIKIVVPVILVIWLVRWIRRCGPSGGISPRRGGTEPIKGADTAGD